MYLCLIMCFTWRFMVMKKSTKKYSRRIGQKTGTSKMGKNVASMPKRKDLAEEYLHKMGLRVCYLLFPLPDQDMHDNNSRSLKTERSMMYVSPAALQTVSCKWIGAQSLFYTSTYWKTFTSI